MGHISAQSVLPEEVVELIQQYIDGEYLYIPRKIENKKSWGEKNGTKNNFKNRDKEIFNKYTQGTTVVELAEVYYLSEKSIRRILSKEKRRKL
ncbi:CD3324 family protein [Alkaliphilus hydrothermalis]|uniref:Mor family transcriptional regulator n=1 Tax=Alkaliphilus hydrothermalis TaxID=1482730 RepID=A0ABS2NPL0_9FIRM|nr:CD3324 family protein [Alkaliphilus hydrothermalis]MBM7614883.1 Mor family transcriptional regulator [Alkaliphilus hydrothermalis]